MDSGPGSTVTVDFIDRGDSTEVRLIHAGLEDAYSGFVKDGWTAGLERLAGLLAAAASG
jgi:hypothetical protein